MTRFLIIFNYSKSQCYTFTSAGCYCCEVGDDLLVFGRHVLLLLTGDRFEGATGEQVSVGILLLLMIGIRRRRGNKWLS